MYRAGRRRPLINAYASSFFLFFCLERCVQVNFRNFCYYMVVPSLVYEPYFLRGKGFRPAYFTWKLVSLVSAMVGQIR